MAETKIEWADEVWNALRGCSRCSPGCVNCYAERQAHRFSGPGRPYHGLTTITNGHPQWTGEVRLVPEQLDFPLRLKQPSMIFVNSMSDLFHETVGDSEIALILGCAMAFPQHIYQILTKRAQRMHEFLTRYTPADCYAALQNERSLHRAGDEFKPALWARVLDKKGQWPKAWPSCLWFGVSVENQKYADERIPLLLRSPVAIRWVSYEPALGPVDFVPFVSRTGPYQQAEFRPLDWIVVGGESGPGARPCDRRWIYTAVRDCREAGVAVFVKQLGRFSHIDKNGTFLPLKHKKGGDMSEWPCDLQVREYPRTIQSAFP